MLCDNCKNKVLCKYYSYIKNIPFNIDVQINYCEKYSNCQSAENVNKVSAETVRIKQPIDYAQFNLSQNPISDNESEEVEERIIVNLEDHIVKKDSIIDMFLDEEDR